MTLKIDFLKCISDSFFERFWLLKNTVFFADAEEQHLQGFRAIDVGFGAKICDLRDFFENTRCCGKTCNKIAYMVKYGRTHKRDTMPVF